MYDDWKELIGDDDVENAFDGVNDEDGLPRGTNEGGSDGYTRHEHCKQGQALENTNTEFAPRANAPTGRADRVLVKTGAAHRFLVSENLTLLPRQGEGAGCLTGH